MVLTAPPPPEAPPVRAPAPADRAWLIAGRLVTPAAPPPDAAAR
jgi:hypothetical protein